MRQRWVFRSSDGQLVPRGTKCAVYGFKVVSYASPVNPYTTVTFYDGGAAGTVKNIVSAAAGAAEVEGQGDINEYIEFSDGVYVDIGVGTAAEAGILVYDGAGS